MPAKSKKQQMAAGAALAAKRGESKKSSLKGASKGMYESMSKAELRKMAKTKRKGKPTRDGTSRRRPGLRGEKRRLLICQKRRARPLAKRAPKPHGRKEAGQHRR